MLAFTAKLLARLYGIYVILMFTGVTIPTLALLAVVPGESNRRSVARNAARLWLWLSAARPSVSGREHLPAQPCVVVANHASYLDGVILTAVLPARFTFVIKKEMTRVPFANYFLSRIGSLFVDRSNYHRAATDARRILQLAAQKKSIAFFPEGTFTAEPGLRRFRNGAFTVAQRGRPASGSGRHSWKPANASGETLAAGAIKDRRIDQTANPIGSGTNIIGRTDENLPK